MSHLYQGTAPEPKASLQPLRSSHEPNALLGDLPLGHQLEVAQDLSVVDGSGFVHAEVVGERGDGDASPGVFEVKAKRFLLGVAKILNRIIFGPEEIYLRLQGALLRRALRKRRLELGVLCCERVSLRDQLCLATAIKQGDSEILDELPHTNGVTGSGTSVNAPETKGALQ